MITPENARSFLVMSKLCGLRDWMTDQEGEIGLGKDSCIASVRMVQEVGRYFGLPIVRPIPVEVCVFNASGFEEYEAWHRLPAEEKDVTPMKLQREESWAVAVDGVDENVQDGSHGGRWNGHLIAQVQDLFVDFSLDQFSRPEKDMEVIATVFPVQTIWNEHRVAVYKREDGVAVVYRHMPGATLYRSAPDWAHFTRWKPVMGLLINKLKEELA